MIEDVKFYIYFNSRGKESIHVELFSRGKKGVATAPSGKSTGKNESIYNPFNSLEELKEKAKELKKKIVGFDLEDQKSFDHFLIEEGGDNFENLGTIFSVPLSFAYLDLSSKLANLEKYEFLNEKADVLPYPIGNVFGGGLHSNAKQNKIQEILLLPYPEESFFNAYKKNIDVYKKVETLLRENNLFFAKNDEGAISANVSEERALNYVFISSNGYTRMGLDVAASSFFSEEKGVYEFNGEKKEEEFIDYILKLHEKYNFAYLEDPIQEESFEGFSEITKKIGDKVLIVGDDLYCTKMGRLILGIKKKATNAILIKPNQVGTITQTEEVVYKAKEEGLYPVISHRSGETCDSTISHLAVGWEIPAIKVGILSGERIAKNNELIRIESLISEKREPKLAKIKILEEVV